MFRAAATRYPHSQTDLLAHVLACTYETSSGLHIDRDRTFALDLYPGDREGL